MKKSRILVCLCLLTLAVTCCFSMLQQLPDNIFVADGEPVSFLGGAITVMERAEPVGSLAGEGGDTAVLALFGVVPLKTVTATAIERVSLYPCGTPFGIKMLTDGVVVIGLGSVYGVLGVSCPAKDAGIQSGDVLHTVDGKAISGNRDLAAVIAESGGEPLEFVLTRGEKTVTVSLAPAKSTDGVWKAGLWVRDSTAGIGMLTYYDADAGIAAGLGHAVSDVDTGIVMPVLSGEFAKMTITGVRRGVSGSAGELKGRFLSEEFACVIHNGPTGIYGKLTGGLEVDKPLPIALKHEVKRGAAYILTTVNGAEPKRYEIKIERIYLSDKNETQNMIIRITDGDLLKKTGGIVAGMSGSPIIQNGMIIGAVTHVFINDPTRGYGIFIENMLETQACVASDSELAA